MAKSTRTAGTTGGNDNLGDELIQQTNSQGLGTESGNPGHETQTEGTGDGPAAEAGADSGNLMGQNINLGTEGADNQLGEAGANLGTQNTTDLETNTGTQNLSAENQEAPETQGLGTQLPKMQSGVYTTSGPLPVSINTGDEHQGPFGLDTGNRSNLQEESNVPMYPNDPTNISPADLHADRVKRYGEDYVVTTKGKSQQVWARNAWKQLRGNTGGWKEAIPVPPEVQELRRGK